MVDHILEIPGLTVLREKCLTVIPQNYVYEVIPFGTNTI